MKKGVNKNNLPSLLVVDHDHHAGGFKLSRGGNSGLAFGHSSPSIEKNLHAMNLQGLKPEVEGRNSAAQGDLDGRIFGAHGVDKNVGIAVLRRTSMPDSDGICL
ncbi:hypothetical protein TrRE_jg10332, partial [Triparma retinervis]